MWFIMRCVISYLPDSIMSVTYEDHPKAHLKKNKCETSHDVYLDSLSHI